MKRGAGDTAGRANGAARKDAARAARSLRNRKPGGGAPTRDATPTPGLASDRVAPTAEKAPGFGGHLEEVAQHLAQLATALHGELPNSRAMRLEAERSNDAILPLLQDMRECREFLALQLEKLKARGLGKDAAQLAFRVAKLDQLIEDCERIREANDDWTEMSGEFEARVDWTCPAFVERRWVR